METLQFDFVEYYFFQRLKQSWNFDYLFDKKPNEILDS